MLSINIHVCQLEQHQELGVHCLPINTALGFICYYPQVLFLHKVGVTLSTENCTLEAFLLLPFFHLVSVSEREREGEREREREREREGPERTRKTFNEAHSEVR